MRLVPYLRYRRKRDGRRGQVALFLLMILMALTFILLSHIDLHRVIRLKDKTQNAGDAAALAAARWQGATLNLAGELNLMHVLALAAQNPMAEDAITNMQARLCFTGPMLALMAAQIAAKNNQMYVDQDMTGILQEHAARVRTQYGTSTGGGVLFNEPWPGAWEQYAAMLQGVADSGIAAGVDNARFFADPTHGHPLLDKAFYEAVLGRTWCWFHLYQRGLIASYRSFRSWPPLPRIAAAPQADSELLGLGLTPVTFQLGLRFSPEELESRLRDAGFTEANATMLAATNVMTPEVTWYIYHPAHWGVWTLIRPDGETPFPVTGRVRPQYDVAGADAVMRVNTRTSRAMPNQYGRVRVNWTAAAKPFGYLEGDGGREPVTAAAGLVLPAFRNTRLIPTDSATGAEYNTADVEWIRHIRGHLPHYTQFGPSSRGCSYCQALAIWESAEFRQEGVEWLQENSHLCRIPTSGGTRRGGGARRGH